MNKFIGALLAILVPAGLVAQVLAPHGNPVPGDVWTFFGPTLGGGWGIAGTGNVLGPASSLTGYIPIFKDNSGRSLDMPTTGARVDLPVGINRDPASFPGIELNVLLSDTRFELDPIRHDPILGYHYWSPSADTSATGNGVFGLAWAVGSNNFTGYNDGVGGTFAHNGTGTVARGIGVYGSCENDTATGVITECSSIYADKVYPVGVGTVGISHGIHIVSGGSATKNDGVYFDGTFSNDGSIASASGVNITIKPGGALNNANLGVGIDTPGAKVDVNGTVRTSSYFIASNASVERGYYGSYINITGSGPTDPAIYTTTGNIRLANGGVVVDKKAASGAAPGTGTMKIEAVAGTNAGTCKLIAYAGTSGTAVTIVDNVGTGC